MGLKINGVEYECADSWDKTKTRQYQRIVREWDQDKPVEERNFFKLFGILTDSNFSSFNASIENELKIWHCVEWVTRDGFPERSIKTFTVGDKTVDIPQEIKYLSIGQNIHARQALEKSATLVDKDGNIVDCDCYSLLVAIYIQPLIDGGVFNFQKAKELEKVIAEMPITEVRSVGFFLLQNAVQYGKRRVKRWNQTRTNLIEILRKAFQR